MSAEELLQMTVPEARRELVRGELIVREPAGFGHGDIAARLLIAVGTFVESRSLGRVFAAETGFAFGRIRTRCALPTSLSSGATGCPIRRPAGRLDGEAVLPEFRYELRRAFE